MALVKCAKCGMNVSDKASKCIHCGTTDFLPKEEIKIDPPKVSPKPELAPKKIVKEDQPNPSKNPINNQELEITKLKEEIIQNNKEEMAKIKKDIIKSNQEDQEKIKKLEQDLAQSRKENIKNVQKLAALQQEKKLLKKANQRKYLHNIIQILRYAISIFLFVGCFTCLLTKRFTLGIVYLILSLAFCPLIYKPLNNKNLSSKVKIIVQIIVPIICFIICLFIGGGK